MFLKVEYFTLKQEIINLKCKIIENESFTDLVLSPKMYLN